MYRQRESDCKSAVEDANARFYRAFKNKDLKVSRTDAGYPSAMSNQSLASRVHLEGLLLYICFYTRRLCQRSGAVGSMFSVYTLPQVA